MSHAAMIIGIPGLQIERVKRSRDIEVWARPYRRPPCKHCHSPERSVGFRLPGQACRFRYQPDPVRLFRQFAGAHGFPDGRLQQSLYNASSVAEVIRAGFVAVPQGQWEAARSLGLSPWDIRRHVVVPQAMRIIIPLVIMSYLNIFKATSLVAAIGYPEVVSVMVGITNNTVGLPVEIMLLTFAVYSLVSLLGIWLMGHVNRHYNRFDPV